MIGLFGSRKDGNRPKGQNEGTYLKRYTGSNSVGERGIEWTAAKGLEVEAGGRGKRGANDNEWRRGLRDVVHAIRAVEL